MKKVYTITFHLANNYGAMLQAYALQNFLKEKYETKIVNYDNKYISDSYRIIKTNEKNIVKVIYHFMKKFIFIKKELERINDFKKFRQKLILTSMCSELNSEELKNLDAIIVGSDQVWNTNITNGIDNFYFLNYQPNYKKISYAASCGDIKYIEEQKEKCLRYINDFECLSAREEELTNYLKKELQRKKISTVLDPTFLLEKTDWEKIISNERLEKEKYLFVYTVSKPNEFFYKTVNKYAKMKNLKIVYFDKFDMKGKYRGRKKSYYNVGPEKFLNLLYYSEFVITSSFHGTAMSCILNKDFLTILSTCPSRIKTLLETLELTDRIITENKEYCDKSIEWKNVNQILKIERNKSRSWLKDAIESREHE